LKLDAVCLFWFWENFKRIAAKHRKRMLIFSRIDLIYYNLYYCSSLWVDDFSLLFAEAVGSIKL
jgi:hypothetical protein